MGPYVVEGKLLTLDPGTPDCADLQSAAVGHDQTEVESPHSYRSALVGCDLGPGSETEVLRRYHPAVLGDQRSQQWSLGNRIRIVNPEVANRGEVPAERRAIRLGMLVPSGAELRCFRSELAPAGLEGLEDISAALDVEEAVVARRLASANDAIWQRCR